MKHGLVLMDMDGTLIQTVPLYYDAIKRYSDWMEQWWGYPSDQVSTLFQAHDTQRALEHGFSRHRFPQSMEEVAREYWEGDAVAVTPAMVRQARAFGYSVFRRKAPLFPDTHQVLAALSEHFALHLYTMGDEEVQTKRIEDANIYSYFLDIDIVPRKTPDVLRGIIARYKYRPEHIWLVDDSLRNMADALLVGIHGVHIAGPSWGYEHKVIDATTFTSAATLSAAAIHLLTVGVPRVRDVDERAAV